MRTRARLLSALAASIAVAHLVGCGAAPSAPCKQSDVSPSSSAVSSSSAAEAPPPPAVSITIKPAATPKLHVEVHLEIAEKWASNELVIGALALGALDGSVSARDAKGPIDVAPSDMLGGFANELHMKLARPASGALTLDYSVRAVAPAYPAPSGAIVDPDRFESPGEALLLLPASIEKERAAIDLHVDTSEIGAKQYSDAATSFGLGKETHAMATGRELRTAMFVAAMLGRAHFDGPEGKDDAVWVGYTAFDPRPAAADMAGFRTAVRELFKPSDASLATMFFLADNRPAGAYVASRRAHGVVVRVGPAETWSGPMRIQTAAALLHEWVGDRLWIGPTAEIDAGQATWFSEGVVRDLARDLLFRFGLLTPIEAASDLESLAAIVATSPLASEDNATLARSLGDPGALSLLVARGGLYAARIDALMRAKSGAKRGLVNLVTDLYAKAAKDQAALPTSAWVDAIRAELGDDEAGKFDELIGAGKPIDLPENALGPCFARVQKTYTSFALGFDRAKTNAAEGNLVQGIDPKGPAARAGLKEGDKLVSISYAEGRADVKVELDVDRGGKAQHFSYLPQGVSGKGWGWQRKRDVPDEQCAR